MIFIWRPAGLVVWGPGYVTKRVQIPNTNKKNPSHKMGDQNLLSRAHPFFERHAKPLQFQEGLTSGRQTARRKNNCH
jgi:hypothetical protein